MSWNLSWRPSNLFSCCKSFQIYISITFWWNRGISSIRASRSTSGFVQDAKHWVSSCVVSSAPWDGRTLVAEVLLCLRGKGCNRVVTMLCKGAFVSFAIRCSNRVIAKNISSAGREAALEPGEGFHGRSCWGSRARWGQSSAQGAPEALPSLTASSGSSFGRVLVESFGRGWKVPFPQSAQAGEPQKCLQVPPWTVRGTVCSGVQPTAECTSEWTRNQTTADVWLVQVSLFPYLQRAL